MVCFCSGLAIVVCLIIVYKLIWNHLRKETVGNYDKRALCINQKATSEEINTALKSKNGCDTGFGNLLSKRLDGLGCHVFSGCFTDHGADALQKECSSRLVPVKLDVTKPESVRNAYQFVKSKLPTDRGLWAVVNNAGIGGTFGAPEWLTINDYKATTEVNLYGTIDVTMTFLPLIKQEKGRVVNTSSIAGRITSSPLMPYCVSKYGVESFSDGLRRVMHPYGVEVIIMEPGWTATTMTARDTAIVPGVVRGWEQAPQEIKEEYGEEYYNFCKKDVFDNLDRLGATDPLPVIDALQEAILGRYPRTRYVTGIDGSIYMPLTFLPDPILDFLLRLTGPPKPAKLKHQRYA